MKPRSLATQLCQAAQEYPVVSLTGPRQSGKTTLARAAFPDHQYLSLEQPDVRAYALDDPRGFLGQLKGNVILDEVQRAPDLFSYIQGIVDEEDRPGRFILTGSQNFLLLRSISQTLAGRVAVLHLLPFSLSELKEREPLSLEEAMDSAPDHRDEAGQAWHEALFKGFYPRIHDRGLDPTQWLANYYQTYVERDVREIIHVGDLENFGRFVRLCAGRSAQLLNLSSLATDAGISHTTARRWISILETSFLIKLLRPHHQNFNKRLIKGPKLYFLDSGLLCYLLGITSAEELAWHSARGNIFESFVLSEVLKSALHQGREARASFWRDSNGHEIDFLVDRGMTVIPIEAKSGSTIANSFFSGIDYWRRLAPDHDGLPILIHGGDRSYFRKDTLVLSWSAL